MAIRSGKISIVIPDEIIEHEYNQQGLDYLLRQTEKIGAKRILICGNWRWALPAARYLIEKGKEIRYLALPKKGRGKKMPLEKTLIRAMEKNLSGRPFFREEKEQAPHPWVIKVNEYFKIKGDQRRIKLRINDRLRILVPEAFAGSINKVFTKKGRKTLKFRDWTGLIELTSGKAFIKENLLINFIPKEEIFKLQNEVDELLKGLEDLEEKIEFLKREISAMVEDHPISQMFDGALTAKLLACLIGWRDWPEFRVLRSYCGLALTRIDSKGKLRISRIHPQIRAILFQMMKIKRVQEIVEGKLRELGRKKAPLPKRMEILLKEIWKECLK